MPFFSIIIPLYNKENFIADTLNSVLHQTFTDFEVLLINDGSTDKSEAIALQFKDSRIRYFSKQNEGVSKTRNFGIENATSDFICFLDADDYWYPNFLEEFHTTIETYPDNSIFSCAIEMENASRTFPAMYSIARKSNVQIVNYFEASLKKSIIWTSSVVIHKSVFEYVGKFDSEIKYGEDINLWIRIGLDYPVVFNWKILSKYVYDKNSVSREEHSISTIEHLSRFKDFENENPFLHRFLDLNRFSTAIKYKLIGRHDDFRRMYDAIDFNSIGVKKRILLQLPAFVLRKLIALKSFLSEKGLSNSVFK